PVLGVFLHHLPLSFLCNFLLYCHRPLRDLHSFPTRRSSDLHPPPRERQSPHDACPQHATERLQRRNNPPPDRVRPGAFRARHMRDRKSTRLNSSHVKISYAVFCLKKKKKETEARPPARQHTQ